jgi:hypothetical protein
MITGQRTFQAASQAGLIAAILSSEPQRPSLVRNQLGAVSPLLDHVVEQCLAKDPEERWQTARDLMLQLEWMGEGDVPSEPPRLPRRKTSVAWLISGVLAVVLLAIAAFLALDYLGRRPQRVQIVRLTAAADRLLFSARQFLSLSRRHAPRLRRCGEGRQKQLVDSHILVCYRTATERNRWRDVALLGARQPPYRLLC